MKIAGIICEYNPFHKGHEYQLNKTREETGADVIICAMSGACVQRGDIAILDKWTRAKMALEGGADVIFELPAMFALRAAQDFAMGGVSLLNAAGADFISFGSETDDIKLLNALVKTDDSFDSELKKWLSKGYSYPRAVQAAYDSVKIPADISDAPNVILCVEYLRAVEKTSSEMQPVIIKRDRGDGLSASVVRSLLLSNEKSAAFDMLPGTSVELIGSDIYNSFVNVEQAALFFLRNTPVEILGETESVAEGLEMRIKKAAGEAASLDEMLHMIKCKRYTMARIRRAVLCAMLGITKELCSGYEAVPYLRLLGFRKSAAPYLAHLRESCAVPVINKAASAEKSACFEIDLQAQNLFDLGTGQKSGRDFRTSPVIL